MKKHLFLLFLLITIALPSIAQSVHLTQKPDCSIANLLISKDTIVIDSLMSTAGENKNEIDVNSCMMEEFSSSWFTWTCTKSGTLAFTIIPKNEKDDIDFMIFESEQNDCNNTTTIRCMAAGELVGNDSLSQFCMGNTGLSLASTDVQEIPGCANGNDNFLKALDMIKGQSYFMVINNFSSTGLGYQINFSGDGEVGTTSGIEEENDCPTLLTTNFVTNMLNLNTCTKFSKLNIYNHNGKLVTSASRSSNKINVNHLVNGLYFISILDDEHNMIKTEKFYVNK